MTDLATALWNQRLEISAARDRLLRLHTIVNWPSDMLFASCIHLYAMCLEFSPDLIVEVGRGYGNSTCIFTEAANRLNNTKVVSVGYDGERCWTTRTAPALRKFVSEQWFERLEIVEQDALQTNFSKIISNATSVLLFWDAHGLKLANYILAEVLPHLKNKKNLTMVHDIRDARFDDIEPCYVRSDGYLQYWLGDLVGVFEEVIPLFDFLSRNRINFDTPQHSIGQGLNCNIQKVNELQNCWGCDFPSPTPLDAGGFVYFDLNDRCAEGETRDLVFPQFEIPHETIEGVSHSKAGSESKKGMWLSLKKFRQSWQMLARLRKA